MALAVWALALLLSSPSSTAVWGINGLRTLSGAWPALLLGAVAARVLATWRPRSPWAWAALGVILAGLLAFPLREKVHLLGDTQLRMRALFAAQFPGVGSTMAAWATWLRLEASTLHAAPLDMAFDVLPPLLLHTQGLTVANSVAWVDAGLALAYMALAWRLASRLAPEAGLIGPLAFAVVLTGVLEAFAGYADSAGLIALAAMGWWAEIMPPLERPAQAWRATAWFGALLLSHRMGLVMLVPQLLRALGPAIPGDYAPARRTLLALTGVAVALGVAAAVFTGAGRQLLQDFTELARSARGFQLRPFDVASALMVVAPLALVAPAVAGRAGAAFWREPRAWWVASGALPLLVGLAWVFPVGENGLGAHRDWDTNVLLGVTLMVGAVAWLARAGAARLEAALAVALPLLALTALSWVAVNADSGLATRRAIAMAESPTALTGPQRAHLHVYFGQRAMDERRPDVAAQHYQRAFRDGGNPRRALLAAEAWMMAGRPDAARAALAEARAAGPLSPELDPGVRDLEARLSPPDTVGSR